MDNNTKDVVHVFLELLGLVAFLAFLYLLNRGLP